MREDSKLLNWKREYYYQCYRNRKDYMRFIWILYAYKLDNLDEMNKFLQTLPKLNHREIEKQKKERERIYL